MSLSEIATPDGTKIESLDGDPDGSETVKLLKKLEKITQRLIGNNGASLGLHPFVWFYTSQGRHYEPLFLAVFAILAKKLLDNDDQWFKKFSAHRGVVEEILIRHKTIMTLLISALGSKGRISGAQTAVEFIIAEAASGKSDIELDALAGKLNLTTRLYTIQSKPGADFSDEAKSSSFLKAALASALKCPICKGYLDPSKSVSYDHKIRKQDGGDGAVENCQLAHPYCNTAIKN